MKIIKNKIQMRICLKNPLRKNPNKYKGKKHNNKKFIRVKEKSSKKKAQKGSTKISKALNGNKDSNSTNYFLFWSYSNIPYL